MTTKNTELKSFATALQGQFKADANVIRNYFKTAVAKRGEWLANAVMFGILASKAKEELKNGFSDWLESVCVEAGKSKRTGYNYIHLAQIFLKKIVTSRPGDTLFVAIELYKEQSGKTFEALFETEKSTLDVLSFVFSAIPESTLNEVLRESNAAALDTEESEKKALTKSQLKGLQGGGNKNSGQLNFFEDLYREVRSSIEVNRQDPRFLAMSKAELQELGDYLVLQGKEIQNLAKNTR